MFLSKNTINAALKEYLPLINKHKPFRFGLSAYRVDKPWGYEVWLALNKFYAMKFIHMKAGHKSSLQVHKKKREANYIVRGSVDVFLEDCVIGKMVKHRLTSGDGWTVVPRQQHRVVAVTDYDAIEVSTPHLNDVIRLDDDSGRGSGKIGAEHGV